MRVDVYTHPVRPGELRLLDLEIDKSGQGDAVEKPGGETDDSIEEEECQANTNSFAEDSSTCTTSHSPEKVDDALEVSGDQHQQGDDGGEDEGRRWSQPVDVSHGQNIWLQSEQGSG